MVDFFSIDGRLWRSLGALVARPGHLTRAYLAGRRARYLTPLRLYLISSLLFFFLLTLIDPANQLNRLASADVAADSVALVSAYQSDVEARLQANEQQLEARETSADSVEQVVQVRTQEALDRAGRAAAAGGAAGVDSFSAGISQIAQEGVEASTLERRIEQDRWLLGQLQLAPPDSTVAVANYERAAELIMRAQRGPAAIINVGLPDWWPETEFLQALRTASTTSDMVDAGAALLRQAINRLPTVMFILLPLFALLLKILYVRRGWFYSEHLVFGLHTHAFAFLVFTVILLLIWRAAGAPWASTTIGFASLTIPLYFLLAQKKVYGQGWLRTLGKALVLGWVYSFFVSMGAVAAILLAL